MTPFVVWASQAPTLLNRLWRSSAWELEHFDLGDYSGLAEHRLLQAPRYTGRRPPDAVFVCTIEQWRRARTFFPKAKLVWVFHNGRRELLPPEFEAEVAHSLSFSDNVRQRQARDGVEDHVIVPSYRPEPSFGWAPDEAWALLNRPKTRVPDHADALELVQRLSGVEVAIYGQGQSKGFLDDKRALYGNCSCYVSVLPAWAGFGLAEHECMAAGVPVVGNPLWGDMGEEAPAYRGFRPWPAQQAMVLSQLAQDWDFARDLSEAGLSFIEKWRTPERMDEGIQALLDAVQK